ncbi:MAG: thioredoxin domain-containing protein [Planctomycetes bacterium]|nr:thioredoxin domain-containing protein [Planctomycetota bacterium]
MPNRLAYESSPYLLQHRNNPVDWYPWGDEAIEKARRDDKPIFLSIGYSACHWCHVMEHESFESDAIARVLNENFVAVKVDREERPDLDQIYMNAVQMLTGHGGWPMSVFLTPDLKPFYGGTYWPPRSSRGMPGFDQILAAVIDAWKNRRDQALTAADQLTAELRNVGEVAGGDAGKLSMQLIDTAVGQLRRAFDNTYGGFGQAPKFPHPMDLQLLVRVAHRSGQPGPLDMVRLTLDRMASGGIYDHLGGGFARYSVDARWLVPHFEKMLYDNALLAGAYLDAYLVTGDQNYARVLRETLNYVIRDMTDPAGGFYSTEDADSEGHEGLFYTWTPDEIEAVLGDARGATFGRVYDVSDVGNFEGRNILNLPKTLDQCAKILGRDRSDLEAELADSREKLFAAREKRVRPGRDDKIIVAWNGLMIDAMARAGAALNEPEYVITASEAASFILSRMRRDDGRLLHTSRGGVAKLDAYLDDYASLANSLVSLYEASFNERWIDEAVGLLDVVLDQFADPDGGGFFYTAADHEQLITRTKELTDSSTPSGNALAATALLRLGKLLGRTDYLEAAAQTLAAAVPLLERAPMAAGQMLLALDRHLGPAHELVLVGDVSRDDTKVAIAAVQRRFLPHAVIAIRDSQSIDASATRSARLDELFAGKHSTDGRPVLYVCQNFACQEPAVGLAAIETQLQKM